MPSPDQPLWLIVRRRTSKTSGKPNVDYEVIEAFRAWEEMAKHQFDQSKRRYPIPEGDMFLFKEFKVE